MQLLIYQILQFQRTNSVAKLCLVCNLITFSITVTHLWRVKLDTIFFFKFQNRNKAKIRGLIADFDPSVHLFDKNGRLTTYVTFQHQIRTEVLQVPMDHGDAVMVNHNERIVASAFCLYKSYCSMQRRQKQFASHKIPKTIRILLFSSSQKLSLGTI